MFKKLFYFDFIKGWRNFLLLLFLEIILIFLGEIGILKIFYTELNQKYLNFRVTNVFYYFECWLPCAFSMAILILNSNDMSKNEFEFLRTLPIPLSMHLVLRNIFLVFFSLFISMPFILYVSYKFQDVVIFRQYGYLYLGIFSMLTNITILTGLGMIIFAFTNHFGISYGSMLSIFLFDFFSNSRFLKLNTLFPLCYFEENISLNFFTNRLLYFSVGIFLIFITPFLLKKIKL